ncbi:MAG: hypothetical protein WBQ68_18310 [Terriglobales bacterium]
MTASQSLRRELWFEHGRVVPGQASAGLRYRAHRQKLALRASQAAAPRLPGINALPRVAVGTVWTPLGPAPLASDASGVGVQDYGLVAGRATAVAIDPADGSGNTVYIGGAYGGVWKSINAGPASQNPSNVTWTPITDDQPTLAVGAIAIQPQLTSPDPTRSVILVGTGETNSSSDSYYGLGILRSADAGHTWTLISQDSTGDRSFAGLGFSKIAFSTVNPNLVVAAAAGATQGVVEGLEDPVIANRGLYYSNDGGQSWTYATVKDAGLVIDPSSVSSVIYNATARQFFAAIQWHGIYSSSDGITWSRLNNQPGGLSPVSCPATPSTSTCLLYRGEFAVVPGRNEMYFWYVDGNNIDRLIWQTKDGGSTWIQLDDDGITNCGDVFGGCGTEQGAYNLELAAVPDGDVTDLYAGATNLYKCRITAADPGCGGVPPDTFINLTHAYGCPPDFGSIAHVHPNQHSLAFLQINSNHQVVMYFANDGGIYRALDGYTGLLTGTCGGSNQFDSLNANLGSIAQLVSFSEHPTDPNTILAGAQDNGAPATSSSQSSTSWVNVNSGDGGYNAINPDNPTEWFTANTDVSIQRCAFGVDCRAQDFSSGLVVSSSTVGGDAGGFFTPFILDPQNSGELLVGTCRMWRGATDGSGFSVLTDNFETGGTESCTGGEVNIVRAVAAGGLKDSLGFSNVMYAGTDGLGPLIPTGGHIWSATNVSGGAGAWIDRTGATNPSGFPVSGIAIDSSDATGKTAYMSIMGFHVSHVWKTADAGASWTDFTGTLPDAPANAVLVDASASTVYVGTDVGVFASSTANPNWSEVGPVVTPGASAGFLPNVAVTALGMFNFGGTKKLRASTYGRGMWEFTLTEGPDFQFASPATAITTFAGQSAAFSVSLLALNSFNSPVNLTCTPRASTLPAPPTCAVVPAAKTPTVAGASFTVNASGPVGDYLFNVHGVGTDTNRTTRDFALTLHVVDFNLTPPAPGSVSTNQSGASGPVAFQVTAAGSFNQTVALSCSGLPAGAVCNFQPSASVSPVSGSPATVTLTISAGANTPVGTSQIAFNGSVTGGPTRSQNLSLNVTALTAGTPTFSITVSNPSLTINPNDTAVFNGTLTASGGYNSAVNLQCAGAVPLTCRPSPATLVPTAAGTPFTVTASNDTQNHFNFTIDATGTDAAHIHQSTPVELIVGFNFAINNDSPSQTISAGQTASYNLDVAPLGNGSVFPGNVTLSCSSAGLPPLSSCTFTPSQVASGQGDTNVLLTIVTTAAVPAISRLGSPYLLWYDVGLTFAGIVMAFAVGKKSGRKPKQGVRLAILSLMLGILVACGGGSSGGTAGGGASGAGHPGTTPGTYTIMVNGAVGSVTRTTEVVLTVQ